jgi:3-phenylpropionate/trans-cinnamate dioxygenase ferredoxin component
VSGDLPVGGSGPGRAAAGAASPRPHAVAAVVPAASVPLSFLAAAAAGLAGCGLVLAWAAGPGAADPTADPVVAAAHLGVLAALSMGVLGALHHLTPIVTHRPLRSARLAHATLLAWLAASWMLPLGVAAGQEEVVEAGGGLAAIAVSLVAVNLWPPLSVRGKGTPVGGLRLAVAGLVVTACYGVAYVADRRAGWFGLTGHVVLAHAVVGLFGWLGLAYLTLAGTLWPMFFLANVPARGRLGAMAVWGTAAGVTLLSPGLLLQAAWLGWPGAVLLGAGLAAHLAMLAAHLRHGRRRPGLFAVFVLTSAAWLLAGAGLALAADLVQARRAALAAAAVTAMVGWLLEALAGHALHVVPLIAWPALSSRTAAGGRPARPGGPGLHVPGLAALAYAALTAGIAAITAGFAASQPAPIAAGGWLLVLAAIAAAASLSARPLRLLLHPEPGSAVLASRPPHQVPAPAGGERAVNMYGREQEEHHRQPEGAPGRSAASAHTGHAETGGNRPGMGAPGSTGGWVRVCPLGKLREDRPLHADIGQCPVCVVRSNGRVYAIRDECTHEAVPLSDGEVAGGAVECWKHGSRFDLATGRALNRPATKPVDVYPVRIDGDDVLVRLGAAGKGLPR